MARVIGPGAAALGGTFPLVGRQRELGLLLAAARHPPAVVLVEGEAGIGKSRLVHEAASVLTAEGHRVLTGHCHPLREPYPYGPVVDALRKAGRFLPTAGLPRTAGALAPLLPDLADRLPDPPPRPEDARTQRHQLVQAVASFLDALGPTLLVVEDLHWVDDATRDLLLLLARDQPEQLGLVLTYRAEDLPTDTRVLGAAYRHPPGTNGALLRLTPLSEQDVQELATAALGADATPELCARLFARSEGLPLVAEEDLITLAEHGRQDATGPDFAAELERAEIPQGLRDAVTERLASLSTAAAAIVDAAAVLAVPATEALLTRLAGLDPQEGARALIETLHAAVLREAGSDRYTFRHVLAQQVAYWRVPGPERNRLHRRAIAELETRVPAPLVQIAHHTHAVGDHEAWLRRAEAAADQAVALGDAGTAATLLHRILQQPRLADDLRSRTALALARIAVNGVDYTANAAVLRRILADPRLPVATRGEIRLALGLLVITHAGDRAGFQELECAVDELATRPERAARAMVALAMNEQNGASGRARDWIDRAEQTLVEDSEATRAMVRATRLTLVARNGDPAVWKLLEELPRQGDDVAVLRQTVRALYNVGEIAIELGHDRHAADLLTESRQLARRSSVPYLECYSRIALLRLELLAGHWVGLEERLAALSTEYPGIAMAGVEQALLIGHLATARGRRTRASEHLTAAAEMGARESQVTSALRAAAGLAGLRLAEGAAEDAWAIAAPAVARLRRAAAWARATGLVPVAVEAALARGDRRAAEQLVDDVEHGLVGRDAPGASAELESVRGLLLQEAEPEAAAECFARARDRWRDIGRPYETAGAAARRGRALAGVRPEDAAAHLGEAVDTYTRLGATGDAARCQHLLRELGLARPSSPGRRGYGDRLSPREQQVADLLVVGATNQAIAETLFLSPRTVEAHVAHVLRKLGTTRKAIRTPVGAASSADPRTGSKASPSGHDGPPG
ncbi:AAA family ATPase [Kitasatospora sp. NPDC051914]|uniref:ATP-binding protein n=1 Tax=Kitasatospora sp. NPDC051914 TaxID=3154945 RepID=UPI003428A15B